MKTTNRFIIRNDLGDGDPATLNIEPEGMFVALGSGKEVVVVDEFSLQLVTVKLDKNAEGHMILSIWPGDGVVRVEEEGVDLLGRDTRPATPGEMRGQTASIPPASVR